MRTTAKERAEVIYRLGQAGISLHDAEALRRVAMTLHRWNEMECGTDNGCIERDETTGIPYWLNSNTMRRFKVADREKGAQKRLAKIMKAYPDFTAYEQGDPRGASLYLVHKRYLEGGKDIGSYYTNGIAVY